jgi:hypothetical protein
MKDVAQSVDSKKGYYVANNNRVATDNILFHNTKS